MTDRFATPVFTAQDANGATVPGAQLFFFTTGTNTAKDTFSDAALTTVNPNPVVADFTGRFGDIFLESGDYKVVLKDADDAVIWTRDPVTGTSTSVGSLTDADGDTKVQVEESADEDKIRFDALGTEIAVIDSNGLNFKIGGGITDADGDTKIQLEEGADDDTIRFDALGTEIMTIDSGGVDILNSKTLGVGAAHDLGVGIHVKSGDSTHTVDATADELVVEGSGDAGATILAGGSDTASFYFGNSSAGGAKDGVFEYDNSTRDLTIRAQNANIVRLTDGGILNINDSGNANMTWGLTINQSGEDNTIFDLKSSDVSQGGHSELQAESDTFFHIRKRSATAGGVDLTAIAESAQNGDVIRIKAWGGAPDSTATTSAQAGIHLFYHQHDDTIGQNSGTNDLILGVISKQSGAERRVFFVDGGGDLFVDGSTSLTAFDDHDDAALVGTFNSWLGRRDQQPDFERMDYLSSLKLLGRVTPEEWQEGTRPHWSPTRLAALHNGWMCQAHVREQVRDTILAQLIPGYRQAMEALASGRNVGSLPELIAA